MDSLLTSPATQIFLDTLTLQGQIEYLAGEVTASVWSMVAVAVSMWALASVLAVRFFRSGFYRRQSRMGKAVTLLGVMSMTVYAGYKNITTKAAADEGISLVSVMAGPTNGVSRVDVVATGGSPEPMWYRNTKDQMWIKGTEDGWTLDYADSDGTEFRFGWTHPSTNDSVTAYNMWYFGENPPAVEVVEEGGVTIVGFAVCGNWIKITWKIDDEVEIPEGSKISVEYANVLGDNIEAWVTLNTLMNPTHNPTMFTYEGFHLDRTTKWRVRLEVQE